MNTREDPLIAGDIEDAERLREHNYDERLQQVELIREALTARPRKKQWWQFWRRGEANSPKENLP